MQITTQLAWLGEGIDRWLPTVAFIGLLATLAVLIGFAISDWRAHRQRKPRTGYRYRRSAYDRFASGVSYQRQRTPPPPAEPAAPPPARPAPPAQDDADDLLRQLLDM
ncbi:hypothetical protein OSCT_0833 [Oscillochloris trichoides DG-6]|uniref:Uncharacterized protein n=1 Tax=Oscillochloris trichoides DG-6 TaxID=765420 RepID=E1IBY2_9CHLR|nr:hypothetical protein [Oscillochloris trichoides]EFO81310.1 hypothetical protein OSCT_0833 [Oscillochloris trichoides DG-6]